MGQEKFDIYKHRMMDSMETNSLSSTTLKISLQGNVNPLINHWHACLHPLIIQERYTGDSASAGGYSNDGGP